MVEISPLLGRRQGMSAAAYTGRAVAPAQVDPETKQLINRNSLQLGIVANQMQNLGAQMQSLTGSLQVIGNSLAAQSQLERQKEAQEAELQNRLAQQKLREGKESVIEKKIQAAALAPANKIAAKAQFTLSRLGSFFTSIFGGWLLMKGIDTISALATGNKDELNKIKNETITGLLVAGGALAAIKIALPAVIATFAGIGTKLVLAAAAGLLFAGPVGQFLNFVKEAAIDVLSNIPGVGQLFENNDESGQGGPEVDAVKTKAAPEPTPAPKVNKSAEPKTSAMPSPPSTGGQGGPKIEPSESKVDETKLTFDFGSGEVDLSKPVGAEGKTTKIDPVTTELSMVEPQETMTGKPAKGKEEESAKNMEPGPTGDAEYGETKLEASTTGDSSSVEPKETMTGAKVGDKVSDPEILNMIEQEKYIGKTGQLPPDMIASLEKSKTVADVVSQAPAEPKVNVVPIPQEQSKPTPEPVSSGGVVAAPFYTTSDPSNIYILSAMSNYNVVSV